MRRQSSVARNVPAALPSTGDEARQSVGGRRASCCPCLGPRKPQPEPTASEREAAAYIAQWRQALAALEARVRAQTKAHDPNLLDAFTELRSHAKKAANKGVDFMFRAIAEADRWTKLSYADRHPAGMALVALGILDSALDPLEKSQLLNSDIQYVMDALRKIEGAHDRAWSNFLLAEIEDKWKPVKHVALMAELARQARMSEEDRQAWIQYRTSLM